MSKFLIFLGSVLFLGLIIYCLFFHSKDIEADIASRASQAVYSNGAPNTIMVKADGQTVVLSGTANNEMASQNAETIASNVFGVTSVRNLINIASNEQADAGYITEATETDAPMIAFDENVELDIDTSDIELDVNIPDIDSIIEPPPPIEVAELIEIDIPLPNNSDLQDGAEVVNLDLTENTIENAEPSAVEDIIAESNTVEDIQIITPVDGDAFLQCQTQLNTAVKNAPVLFQSQSGEITPQSHGVLNTVTNILKSCPSNAIVHIQSHTHTQGDARKNLITSGIHAKNIAKYLNTSNPTQKLRPVGFGELVERTPDEERGPVNLSDYIAFKVTPLENTQYWDKTLK